MLVWRCGDRDIRSLKAGDGPITEEDSLTPEWRTRLRPVRRRKGGDWSAAGARPFGWRHKPENVGVRVQTLQIAAVSEKMFSGPRGAPAGAKHERRFLISWLAPLMCTLPKLPPCSQASHPSPSSRFPCIIRGKDASGNGASFDEKQAPSSCFKLRIAIATRVVVPHRVIVPPFQSGLLSFMLLPQLSR
eukprot:scaffold743_cov267-Pinguiococcus_pyrenoidosus.AAC.14